MLAGRRVLHMVWLRRVDAPVRRSRKNNRADRIRALGGGDDALRGVTEAT
jgi:hypothetical protein